MCEWFVCSRWITLLCIDRNKEMFYLVYVKPTSISKRHQSAVCLGLYTGLFASMKKS